MNASTVPVPVNGGDIGDERLELLLDEQTEQEQTVDLKIRKSHDSRCTRFFKCNCNCNCGWVFKDLWGRFKVACSSHPQNFPPNLLWGGFIIYLNLFSSWAGIVVILGFSNLALYYEIDGEVRRYPAQLYSVVVILSARTCHYLLSSSEDSTFGELAKCVSKACPGKVRRQLATIKVALGLFYIGYLVFFDQVMFTKGRHGQFSAVGISLGLLTYGLELVISYVFMLLYWISCGLLSTALKEIQEDTHAYLKYIDSGNTAMNGRQSSFQEVVHTRSPKPQRTPFPFHQLSPLFAQQEKQQQEEQEQEKEKEQQGKVSLEQVGLEESRQARQEAEEIQEVEEVERMRERLIQSHRAVALCASKMSSIFSPALVAILVVSVIFMIVSPLVEFVKGQITRTQFLCSFSVSVANIYLLIIPGAWVTRCAQQTASLACTIRAKLSPDPLASRFDGMLLYFQTNPAAYNVAGITMRETFVSQLTLALMPLIIVFFKRAY